MDMHLRCRREFFASGRWPGVDLFMAGAGAASPPGRNAKTAQVEAGRTRESAGPGLAEPATMPRKNGSPIDRIAALAVWALGASCAAQSASQPPQQAQLAQAIAAPDRAGPPEPLSPVARGLLKDRMAAHARDMGELVSAIMLLEYDGIAGRAEKIAADVSLSRPTTRDATELNASIPEKFFVRQDALKAAARNLADAARARDPYKVADAYGKVSETCVRCHADFRPALPDAQPQGAP